MVPALSRSGRHGYGLLRKCHPDLHSKDLERRKIADELTQRLNGAYERLRKRSQGETNRQEKETCPRT